LYRVNKNKKDMDMIEIKIDKLQQILSLPYRKSSRKKKLEKKNDLDLELEEKDNDYNTTSEIKKKIIQPLEKAIKEIQDLNLENITLEYIGYEKNETYYHYFRYKKLIIYFSKMKEENDDGGDNDDDIFE
jgi:hypothetical protein